MKAYDMECLLHIEKVSALKKQDEGEIRITKLNNYRGINDCSDTCDSAVDPQLDN